MENYYQIEKGRTNFRVSSTYDLEVVEESRGIKSLAKKIFENSEIIEAYVLGNLKFLNIVTEDEFEILNEIANLISHEKFNTAEEYDRDN